jgi:hypothetical protein
MFADGFYRDTFGNRMHHARLVVLELPALDHMCA